MSLDVLLKVPDGLPIPIDDGAADHLPGMWLPSVVLPTTDGRMIDLASLPGRVVVYAYPRTGQPGLALPKGWIDIPGAAGCTPQSCAFRDLHTAFQELNTQVFGLSTQTTEYQQEAAERLHLPFALLSDAHRELTDALRLPTFDVAGQTLLKRLALIARDGVIEKVFYPVFPPDKNADEVLTWLRQDQAGNETI